MTGAWVRYNRAIAGHIRSVASAMSAKQTIDKARKDLVGGMSFAQRKILNATRTDIKYRVEAYNRVALTVESFPVAVTNEVVNQQTDSSESSTSAGADTVKVDDGSKKQDLPLSWRDDRNANANANR